MKVNWYKIRFFKLIFAFLICYGMQNNTAFAMQFGSSIDFDLNDPLINLNTEQKTPIIFDLDDTLIKVDTWNMYRAILWKALPWNVFTLWNLKSNRSPDKYGNKRFRGANPEDLAPGGAATSLGFYGLYGNSSQDFQQLVPEILDITWKNAQFIPGAKTLLNYLQTQKYPIIYATNKDYTSYVRVAKTMDEKYNNVFSKYPKLVLVTHPRQETLDKWSNEVEKKQATIPENFQVLIKEIAAGQEDEAKHIYFAGGYEKPEREYYDKLKELMKIQGLNTEKCIFFDDKKINITGAQKYGIDGYTIKTVADIVKGLEQEKIINPEQDQALYAQLERDGVFGFIKQITRSVSSKSYQKEQPVR